MIRSDSPPAYDSALSKKLTPASRAAARQSRAMPVSSCVPNDTHEPKDRTLTCRPDRPRYRCSIAMAAEPTAARRDPARYVASVVALLLLLVLRGRLGRRWLGRGRRRGRGGGGELLAHDVGSVEDPGAGGVGQLALVVKRAD